MSSEIYVLESEMDALDGYEPEVFFSIRQAKRYLERNPQVLAKGDRLLQLRINGALPITYIKSSNTVEIG